MIFGNLANAERAEQMPVFNFEHERARHAGYLALKRALSGAYGTDFVDHALSILAPNEENLKETIPTINVCMWEKKKAGTIVSPAICLGYPRYMRELSESSNIVLDPRIHRTLRNFNGTNILISYDNNLYIKETNEPFSEDVLALAALYYMAHLCGKLDAMVEHITAAIPAVFNKTLYVPTARAGYQEEDLLGQKQQESLKRNGQGVDINVLYRQKAETDNMIRDCEQRAAEGRMKLEGLEREIKHLMEDPFACPAVDAAKAIVNGLKDICVGYRVKDNSIELDLEIQLTDFDDRKINEQWDRDGSTTMHILGFSTGRRGFENLERPNQEMREFYKKVFEKVFRTRELSYMVTMTLVIGLAPFNYSWKAWNGSANAQPLTGYSNPHLYWYNCWSESHSAITKCFNARNYDMMPLYLRSTLGQVTVTDSAAFGQTVWEWHRAFVSNNPARVFVDKEGYAYSIKELHDLL